MFYSFVSQCPYLSQICIKSRDWRCIGKLCFLSFPRTLNHMIWMRFDGSVIYSLISVRWDSFVTAIQCTILIGYHSEIWLLEGEINCVTAIMDQQLYYWGYSSLIISPVTVKTLLEASVNDTAPMSNYGLFYTTNTGSGSEFYAYMVSTYHS